MFKLALGLSYSKGATYIRGFAMTFRPRSITSKVGVHKPLKAHTKVEQKGGIGLAL